jgi:hypothetical protein
MQLIAEAEALLPAEVDLSKNEQKTKVLYPREHAETFAPTLAAIAHKRHVLLEERDLDAMVPSFDRATALKPLRQALTAFGRRVSDTIARDRSEGWKTFLLYYRGLSGMAMVDVKIEADLEPIVDFMSNAKPRKAAVAAPANVDVETEKKTAVPDPAPITAVNG